MAVSVLPPEKTQARYKNILRGTQQKIKCSFSFIVRSFAVTKINNIVALFERTDL
jgi:hypothetical protein